MHINYPANLPISSHKEQIVEAIHSHQVIIVAGDTGSGKTTQLPKMCLEAGRGARGLIGCTQPRRIAAVSIAARLAEELGPQGTLVGHKIRFQDRTSRDTRIKLMTDGILLAEARTDRRLHHYDTVIIDEAHERTLNIDFLLGIMQGLHQQRSDFKLLITSATIDTEKFSKAFASAPVIEVAGRTYPVEVRYQEEDGGPSDEVGYVEKAVQQVVKLHGSASGGDILVFMPTERDIRETIEALSVSLKRDPQAAKRKAVLLPLFGRLAGPEQAKVFLPVEGRKIVVATNVAETSLTVPGIRYVVDSGLARITYYNPRAGTTKMPVARISRASCEQRKGRCGRLGPGICIRLYSEADFFDRSQYTAPEILRANLADVILRMLAFKLGDPTDFPFLDPPSARSIRDGFAMLHELGGIRRDTKKRGRWVLTKQGQLMARLPLDPRMSRMIIEARHLNCLSEIVVIAAALSIQDPRLRPAGQEKEADVAHTGFATGASDFTTYVSIWQAFDGLYRQRVGQAALRRFCKQHYLSYQRMMDWRDIHGQIIELLAEEKGFVCNSEPASAAVVHRAILSGHLRFIAVKKEKNIYLGAGNRECMIFPGSSLFNRAGQWIMAAEMVETSRLYARIVAGIDVDWIEPLADKLCKRSYFEPHWEKKRGQVVAFEKVTLFGLVLVARRKVDFGRLQPEEARQIFIQDALVEGNLGGRFVFFEHNLALRAELEEIEDRLRSRTVMAGETAIYNFYDQRLPPTVRDRGSLHGFLKKERGRKVLFMRREDLLGGGPEEHRLEQFPGHLEIDGAVLPLSYVFDPGGREDGVTVTIPGELVGSLSPEPFDWLVPGLVEEKIVFLLKGLPKALRRPLVPIPDRAIELCAALEGPAGSFYAALEKEIERRYGVRIGRRDWPVDELPSHLRMRFRLTHGGKEIFVSRRFADLLPEAPKSMDRKVCADLLHQWQRDNVTAEMLDGLPDKIPVLNARQQLQGYCFPVLVAEDSGTVRLSLTSDRDEAIRLNRSGLLALYQREFTGEWRFLKKDLQLPAANWMLLDGLPGHDRFNRRLFAYVLETVLQIDGEELPNREEFQQEVARLKKDGLYPLCRALFEQVVQILQLRFEILSESRAMEQKFPDPLVTGRVASVRRELNALIRADFLDQADARYLEQTPRYLQALQIRLRRLSHAPLKDRQKEEEIAPFIERLQQAASQTTHSPEREKLLTEYREMLQELKISLFAQEMKTAFPISAKRLEKKWQELEGFCRPG